MTRCATIDSVWARMDHIGKPVGGLFDRVTAQRLTAGHNAASTPGQRPLFGPECYLDRVVTEFSMLGLLIVDPSHFNKVS